VPLDEHKLAQGSEFGLAKQKPPFGMLDVKVEGILGNCIVRGNRLSARPKTG
jgi:hypothetical protein